MKVLQNVKEKLVNVAQKYTTFKDKIYLEKGSGIVCKDSNNGYNKSIEILASHEDLSADQPITFPRFDIIRSTSRDGYDSTHKKHLFTLDTDDEPTEGSKNLLTSGVLYEIINDLQMQINELKSNKQ